MSASHRTRPGGDKPTSWPFVLQNQALAAHAITHSSLIGARSGAEFTIIEQHPEEARLAVTAALEAVAAHFDSRRSEPKIPHTLLPFVDDSTATDEELIGPEEAARRLGVSRATVYNWIDSKRLLGWRLTRQGTLIPAEQILGRGEVVPGINRVLEVFSEPRTAWHFLKEESPFFDTPIRPIDALKAGKIEDVVTAARTSGEAFT